MMLWCLWLCEYKYAASCIGYGNESIYGVHIKEYNILIYVHILYEYILYEFFCDQKWKKLIGRFHNFK